MRYFWGLEINQSLHDAITVWSEFLVGERGKGDIGVAAAAKYLEDEGFGIPDRPIETRTLEKLRVLATSADELRSASGSTTSRAILQRIAAFEALMSDVSQEFFEPELDITLTPHDPADDPASYPDIVSRSDNTLNDVVEVGATLYATGADFLANVVPNSDSLYNSVPLDTAHDYSSIPPEITNRTVPTNEYNVVDRDVTGTDAAEYFRPPAPEAEFAKVADAARGV